MEKLYPIKNKLIYNEGAGLNEAGLKEVPADLLYEACLFLADYDYKLSETNKKGRFWSRLKNYFIKTK